MSKEKFFKNVVANVCIVFVLLVFSVVAFNHQIVSVFSANDVKAIYSGDKTKNNVSLMINVYWGTEFLPAMLDTLKSNNVKATFFVGGMWASENEELINRFIEDGHEIGNHGYLHKDHTTLSLERNEEEIYVTHKLIKGLCGVDMKLFAPPSGAYDKATLETANKLGYKTIMWTKDTIDWRDQDADLIYARATKNPQNGDLILMHPTECTKNSLKKIIEFYTEKGFNLTTVSECLGNGENALTN